MEKLLKTDESVKQFNLRAGKGLPTAFTDEWWDSLKGDVARVLEEVDETVFAVDMRDTKELLDGVCDIEYTLSKLKWALREAEGINYDGAMSTICENNLTKIVDNIYDAEMSCRKYAEKGIETYVNAYKDENDNEYFAILRKSDNKVMKPYGYESVSLDTFID
jgi:phosphoribosyl-ATP pyrophosphohydrolase